MLTKSVVLGRLLVVFKGADRFGFFIGSEFQTVVALT